MGKNKRRQLEYFDEFHHQKLLCDSNEEIDTLNWLNEAASLGVVLDYIYQPTSLKLFDPVDYLNIDGKKRCLFREHVYSPDFSIRFNPSKFPQLAREFKLTKDQAALQEYEIQVDVKGTFNKTERSFTLNQKWCWQKLGIYIYKLIPKEFFKKLGCPKASFYTKKTKKARKNFAGCKSIQHMMFGQPKASSAKRAK